MRFDRKKFFDSYRAAFGKLSALQVTGLSQLLDFIEADRYIKSIPWASYELATTKHETDDTFHPIHEYGSKAYFIKRYGGQTRKGKELGNDTPEEGYYYSGAGYPQTTGESNFEKAEIALRKEYPEVVADFERRTGKVFDLTVGDQPNDESDPANMMDPAIAYVTMSYGMRTGMFTGKKLSDYISDEGKDYKNARKIINGLDRATLIAEYAQHFENILRDSKLATAPLNDDHGTAETPQSAANPVADTKEVKAEITPEGGVKVETSEPAPGPKERIAVVKSAPKKWTQQVVTKITAAVTGNALFQWLWGQAEKIQGLEIHNAVWIIVSATIAVGTLLWLIHEIIDTARQNKYQQSIDDLLVKENSTANNLVQIIPADEVELYRMRGFKIITRGEKA